MSEPGELSSIPPTAETTWSATRQHGKHILEETVIHPAGEDSTRVDGKYPMGMAGPVSTSSPEADIVTQ